MPGDLVLVWGGSGFIGSHLVARLLATGLKVGVVGRAASPPEYVPWAGKAQWFTWSGGLEERGALRRAVKRARVIFNLAGSSGAVESNRRAGHSLDTICGPQLRFLSTCAEFGVVSRVVFASSRLVYGEGSPERISECATTAPRSMYAAHKLCVEHYHSIFALERKITYTICRISNAFGPDSNWNRESHGFINSLIYRGSRGMPAVLFGDGHQLRDYIFIDDVVEALLLCGFRAEACNQVFNIGCGESISIHAAAREIQQYYRNRIQFVPWLPDYEAVESGDCIFDVSKARAVLGFEARISFSRGVGLTVDAIRAESAAPEQGDWNVESLAATDHRVPPTHACPYPEPI